MRAAIYHGREDVRIEELPDPSPRAGEVVIEVARAGICGTDLHEYIAGRNCQYLWIGVFQATSVPAC